MYHFAALLVAFGWSNGAAAALRLCFAVLV